MKEEPSLPEKPKTKAPAAKVGEVPEEVALDMSGVRPFEPPDPAVTYLCQVTKLENARAKSNPKRLVSNLELTVLGPEEVPAMAWDLGDDGIAKLTGGPSTDKNGSPVMTRAKGRKLFRTFTLDEPNALPFLHEFVKAADPGAKLDENYTYKPSEYMGLNVAVKIENEGYQEQIRSRVKRIMPASAYKE